MEKFNFFSCESPSALTSLFDVGFIRRYQKKTIVFNQGDDSDAVYFVLSGKVKVFVSDNSGRVTIIRLLGPNNCFGELGVIDTQPRSATVIAVVDTILAILPQSVFIESLHRNTEIALSLIPQLTVRIRELTTELAISRNNNAYARLRMILYDLVIEQEDGTLLIEQKFTQQELGEYVGTTRENINRFIKGLKQGAYIVENSSGQMILVKTLPLQW